MFVYDKNKDTPFCIGSRERERIKKKTSKKSLEICNIKLTTISTCILAHFLGVVRVCLAHPILLVVRAVLRVHVLTIAGLGGSDGFRGSFWFRGLCSSYKI